MSPRNRQNGGEGAAGPLDDDDLVSLLYGELEGEDDRAVRSRVADDSVLAGHLAALERVRDLYRELPDEEPPPRISAQLLAQAAHSAAGRRAQTKADPGSGLWARLRSWMQPVVHHPALAGAASLLLIAGVAGTLYLRKGDDLVRTDHARPDLAPASEQPAAPVAPSGQAGGSAAASATLDQAAEERDEAVSGDRADQAEGGELAAESKPRPRKRAPSGAKDGRSAPADRRYSKPDGDADSLRSGTVLGVAEQEVSPPAEPEPGVAPTTAPPAADDSEETGGAPRAPEQAGPSSDAPSTAKKESAERPDDPRALHRQAIAAAGASRCPEVQALGDRIRRVDPAYHANVFSRDGRVTACLGNNSNNKSPAKKKK